MLIALERGRAMSASSLPFCGNILEGISFKIILTKMDNEPKPI